MSEVKELETYIIRIEGDEISFLKLYRISNKLKERVSIFVEVFTREYLETDLKGMIEMHKVKVFQKGRTF